MVKSTFWGFGARWIGAFRTIVVSKLLQYKFEVFYFKWDISKWKADAVERGHFKGGSNAWFANVCSRYFHLFPLCLSLFSSSYQMCQVLSPYSRWIPNSSVKLCCWDYLLLLDIVFLCLLHILLLHTCTHVCSVSSHLSGSFVLFFSVHLLLAEKLSRLWSNTASILHLSVQVFNYCYF
jgi:hypothetical protein